MTDESKILIEELGCSERAADRILSLYGSNLNLAYKHLASRHRNITVMKIKFAAKSSYQCGLMFIAMSAEKKSVLRYAVSISDNPYIFSMDLDMPWHEFENTIYTRRLSDEIVRDKTLSVTQAVRAFLQEKDNESFYEIFDGINHEKIRGLLETILRKLLNEDIFFEFKKERLSVFDFHRSSGPSQNSPVKGDSKIELRVEIVASPARFLFFRSPKIDKINPGAIVFVRITDDREVADYLMRFIGVTKSETLPVEILEKMKKENGFAVTVRLGGSIRGVCSVPQGTRVEIFKG
ncbi:hypothetical protein KJ633_05835 [bacterium]|nr:hypothetical protein [bacterium]MBU3955964.1 hypothetical protein [bacterium]MBU4134105.1 hypothetical protein [bacterium]